MSLRLDFENALTSYLTTVSPSKPTGLNIQAGHRIDDLQVPALIIHAESAEPISDGNPGADRKIRIDASVITPMQETGTATSHSAFFLWTCERLRNSSAICSAVTSGMTVYGSYIADEKSSGNDQAMGDTVSAFFFVTR